MGFVTTDMMRKLLHLPDVEYDRESIGRRKRQEPLPATLQKLREYQWQARNKYSPSELFVLQGKAAENYSDETVYKDPCLHYYPCYSALSDRELRGYFGWRTRVRRGQVEPSNLTFYTLYANELINLIGVKSPEEGYERLLKLRDDYGPKEPTLIMRLNEWLFHFMVYYGVTPKKLPPVVQNLMVLGKDLTYLETEDLVLHHHETVEVLSRHSNYNIKKSLLYHKDPLRYERFIALIYQKIVAYFKDHRQMGFMDTCLASETYRWLDIFETAYFLPERRERKKLIYRFDQYAYVKTDGEIWTLWYRTADNKHKRRLGSYLRMAEVHYRKVMGEPPLQPLETPPKWLVKSVDAIVAGFQEEAVRKARKEVSFDLSKLGSIRKDAAHTRDKLMTEEEMREESLHDLKKEEHEASSHEPAALKVFEQRPQFASLKIEKDAAQTLPECPPVADQKALPYGLAEPEAAFLRALLTHASYEETLPPGMMVSLMIDRINEKLYDEFMDTVLADDGGPVILADYVDDLKGVLL
ncbi:TerB N-terminal domain-containing protein [uncultured Acidaminococcus sp.]|jgi:hypothetical protein|uniref:TerB N-terminal domain-containing protein n=1 Tax=Acidaminococcus sp. TaxID=1872103 RepID=UPI0025D0CCCA|nr:TerB N-terminal domain-containing protein [uncultured Acidaminococcus sp.]